MRPFTIGLIEETKRNGDAGAIDPAPYGRRHYVLASSGKSSGPELRLQMQDTRRCGGKAAGPFIKRCQLGSVIDVQPLAAGIACDLHGAAHQLGADTAMSISWMHARIQQESMVAAIPSDVHESREPLTIKA